MQCGFRDGLIARHGVKGDFDAPHAITGQPRPDAGRFFYKRGDLAKRLTQASLPLRDGILKMTANIQKSMRRTQLPEIFAEYAAPASHYVVRWSPANEGESPFNRSN